MAIYGTIGTVAGQLSTTNIPSGGILQVVTATYSGGYISSTNGANPPTSTSGASLFSQSFTPLSASSTIWIRTSSTNIHEESNVSDMCWIACFRDTTLISCSGGTVNFTSWEGNLNAASTALNCSVASWGTSAATINVRVGMVSPGQSFYANGNTYSNLATGNATIGLTIMEVK